MRKRRLLPMAVAFLLLFPGPGLCEGNGSCKTIAAILSVYPALEVRKSEGPVRSLRDATEHPGCSVHASGPTALILGDVDPAEALRRYFSGSGWEEDLRLAADGPGTTSFAFRKEGVFCRTSGGAHSWIEGGETFTSERYELTVECAPEPEKVFPQDHRDRAWLLQIRINDNISRLDPLPRPITDLRSSTPGTGTVLKNPGGGR